MGNLMCSHGHKTGLDEKNDTTPNKKANIAMKTLHIENEPPRGKTSNVVSEQV